MIEFTGLKLEPLPKPTEIRFDQFGLDLGWVVGYRPEEKKPKPN